MSTTIAHVVPALPPPAEGVGGYAIQLGACLQGSAESCYVVASQSGRRQGAATWRRSASHLLESLEAGASSRLLLHYANYGYATRGCPFWLVRALRHWKRSAGRRRLVTVFHEVRASGRPWQSSFWLGWLQLRLARQIAHLSDATVTTLDRYAEFLRDAGPSPDVMPVFSSVGETPTPEPLSSREPRVVVFGGVGARRRAFSSTIRQLAVACRDLEAAEVIDVGAGHFRPPLDIEGVPVRVLGELPDQEVCAILRGSRFGFLAYPLEFLPKSTIFAAYCANGTLPICAATKSPPSSARLAPHAIPEQQRETHQRIADDAHRWYQGHSLAVQRARFLRHLDIS
ncbi:MAG TPA: hypothetical protein VMT85_01130 [Thermoanaerobaculia bacterium]|nr:hypothetical protein [Thermoanaerobaculia bacterium]